MVPRHLTSPSAHAGAQISRPFNAPQRRTVFARCALLVLISLSAAGASKLAHGQPRPLSQDLLKSIADIDSAADGIARAIQSVKPQDLKLSAREEKYLEGNRERVLRSVDLVRKQAKLVTNRQSLQGLYALKIVVSLLERQQASLLSWAYRIELGRSVDPPAQLLNWINLLERNGDSLDVAVVAFDHEVFELLVNADNSLSNRPSGRK